MSIASEINRISEQKNIIRDKMRDMGLVGQTESPSIDGLASKLKNNVRIDTGSTAREVLEGDSITLEAGYYKANVTISGVTNEAADKQKIKSLDDKITPSKSEQNYVVPEGFYGFGSFTVKAIGDEYKDTSDAKAADFHVLANQIFYNSEGRKVGTMPNNGEWGALLDLSKVQVQIPQGFHDGEGVVTISTEQEKVVTPDKEEHTVAPAPGRVLSTVKVEPIPDKYKDTSDAEHILPEDVLRGYVYYDSEGRKEGKMTPHRGIGITLDATTGTEIGSSEHYFNREYTIPEGYHDGTGFVRINFDDTKEVTPSKSVQWVEADAGSGTVLGMVKVNKIPDKYQDLTSQTVTAADVLNTAKFVAKDGTLTDGAIPNLGVIERYVDPLKDTGWEMGEAAYVRAVSVVINNNNLIAELQKI